MSNRRTVLVVLGLAIISPAFAQAPAARFPFDTTWVAESVGAQKFAPVSRPTLRITRDGKVIGSAGCNRYAGSTASLDGTALTFTPLAMTRMACFGAAGDNERLFAPAISSATQWRMDRRMLVIETAQGPLRLRRR
jgi:heat shock protein HslJ